MAAAAVQVAPDQVQHSDGIRDTIDSIVVAFILAFVFRAFIVEAFIIPTGSMGPTLEGLHGQVRCTNCAYPFDFNLQANHEVITSQFHAVCPNCAYDLTQAAQVASMPETQVMQTSVCPNCGAPVSPTAKFCQTCAAPINAGAGGTMVAGQPYSSGQNFQNYGAQDYSGGAGYSGQSYATGTTRSNKTPLIIGAIVLVLLIGGGLAAYFLLSGSQSPTDVTKKFINAIASKDKAAAKNLAAKSTNTSELDGFVDDAGGDIQRAGGIDTININKEDVNGDTASVQFEIKYKNSKSDKGTMSLVKEDGAWKVVPRGK